MSFSEELKRTRERSFFTQQAFAAELNVAFSTVNRWEGGKARPNLSAMRKIKDFCATHDIEYSPLEEAWLNFRTEERKHD